MSLPVRVAAGVGGVVSLVLAVWSYFVLGGGTAAWVLVGSALLYYAGGGFGGGADESAA